MTRKMLTSSVISYLKDRAKCVREFNRAKSEAASNLGELEERLPPHLHLAEDCGLLTSGGLKSGHMLTLEEAILLRDYGFYIIWVTDVPIREEDKRKDLIYYYKTEMENILYRYMLVIDEKSQGRKPGSSINYIESNDLLRQTIEPLQLDGAKYISRHIFGERAKGFESLSQIFSILFNRDFSRVGLFEQNCLGNLWLIKQKKDNVSKDSKERVRSNFVLRSMLSIALSFISTVKKLQSTREERSKKDINDKGLMRRVKYNESELVEASLAALFSKYGYLHRAIDLLILKRTNEYYSKDGSLNGLGFTFLNEGDKLILDKHSNVSNYLFSSMKEIGFVESVISKDILRHHHRYIDGTGYPKRKVLDEKVPSKDSDGALSLHSHKVFDGTILELTRLVGIISFFVDALNHTPFHIPFQRDNLVRHLIINSVYNRHKDSSLDKNGVYDFRTEYKYGKRFDAYLVDVFLSSIAIYKIEEEVPIYNFNNTDIKLYDAVIIKYNTMPHRPIIKVISGDNGGDIDKEIDLSEPENDFLFIGEYIPSLLFQDVIDEFYLDDLQRGIDISGLYGSVDDGLADSLEGIGIVRNAHENIHSKEKEKEKEKEEQKEKEEEKGKVVSKGPKSVLKEEVLSKSSDGESVSKDLLLGSYYILYYNPAKDTRNKGKSGLGDLKTTAKYIVCVKEAGGNNIIVQFIRLITIKGSDREYVMDKNCGKHFDILKFPFFELGELLSSGDIINFLDLKVL